MSKLSPDMINYLSDLCRIALQDEEKASLFKDLERILSYIDRLDEIDTKNVPVCNQVLKEMKNVMRDDTVGTTLPRETFLMNAPDQIGGLVRVPPVIKKKGNS